MTAEAQAAAAPAGACPTPPRILAVWTRALDGVDSVGGVYIWRAVRSALVPLGELSHARLRSVFERPGAGALASAAWSLVLGLARGRPVPVQCAIFAASHSAQDILKAAERSDVIYADGIRTLLVLRRLRRLRPELRIVVDFQDLMSRRFDEVIARRLPLPLGYMDQMLPPALRRLLASPALARILLSYERAALRHAEREMMHTADCVALVSPVEASLLGAAATRGAPRASVVAIPPPMPAAAAVPTAPPRRAVFIGSDGLMQNRLTIDHLLDLWDAARPPLPLVIYGRQKRPPRDVPGVTWAGYVRDLAEVYTPGSLLVSPTFLRGGIKTKVLEAFAHGVPVIGNPATFEGMDLRCYPFCFDSDVGLLRFLANPQGRAAEIEAATNAARAYVEREHSDAVFRARWSAAILSPAQASTAPERGEAMAPHIERRQAAA
jgi:glycosyltransferase involved in cell wall biosynthesis